MILNEVKKQLAGIPPFKKVIIGVSGGADSMVLAHIMISLGYRITIAHLNHSLRGKESDKDEELVRNMAIKWNVPVITLKVSIPKKGNLENNARKIRYGFLESVRMRSKAKYIAVAHHHGDQTESIIMHLLRGAGKRGMCGMSTVSGNIIRPLLSVKKTEILKYLNEKKIPFRDDETNFDIKYKRNLLRHKIIPELAKKHPDFEKDLILLSDKARAEIGKTEKTAKRWLKKNFKNGFFSISEFTEQSDDVQSEILFIIAGYDDVYSANIANLKSIIKKGYSGKRAKIGKTVFMIQYGKVFVSDKPDRQKKLRQTRLTEKEISWGSWNISYSGDKEIYVREWKSGDRFEPSGMSGSKKLQDFFTDKKIPKDQRAGMPIIVDVDDKILSIADIRLAKSGAELKNFLHIKRIK